MDTLGVGVAEQGANATQPDNGPLTKKRSCITVRPRTGGEEGAAGLFSCRELFTGKCDGLAAAHQYRERQSEGACALTENFNIYQQPRFVSWLLSKQAKR